VVEIPPRFGFNSATVFITVETIGFKWDATDLIGFNSATVFITVETPVIYTLIELVIAASIRPRCLSPWKPRGQGVSVY